MRILGSIILAAVLIACGGGTDDPQTQTDARVVTPLPPDAATSCSGCLASGACQSGNLDWECGYAGATCIACSGDDVCTDGVCQPPPTCGPSNCAGCCDGDTCVGGTNDSACGQNGEACETCSTGLGGYCNGADCELPCGPLNCSGCCDASGTCVTGDQDSACGTAGDQCSNCGGDSCQSGSCVATACAQSCSSGCCSGNTCLGGTSASACGSSGDACIDCGPNRLCESQTCVVDPYSRWDIVVWAGTLNQFNLDNEPWDSFGGLPDPKVRVLAEAGTEKMEATSSAITNTLQPFWGNELVLADVPARLIKSSFEIAMFDYDLNADDFAGKCYMTIDDSMFTGSALQLDCPRNASLSRAGWTVVFRIRPHN